MSDEKRAKWSEAINGEFLNQLKTANKRSSNNKKMRKTLFWILGILLVVFSIAIPTLIFRLNRPFELLIKTNVASMQEVEIKIERGSRLYSILPPEIEGHDFVGWYKDANFTTEFLYTEKLDKDSKLYAAYQLKEFTMNVPINEAYTIDIEDDNTTVYWGGDFVFTLNINSGFVAEDIQITVNGELLNPIATTRDSLTYKIQNIKENIEFDLIGAVSKMVILTVYTDGNPREYEVKDTNNLQRYYTSINRDGYSEFNTIGLFLDENFTKPADLSKRIREDTVVYTKTSTYATFSGDIGWSWDASSKSWHVNLRGVDKQTVCVPSRYSNGTYDGYVTKILGNVTGQNTSTNWVYLPSTVTSLGEYAFYNYLNLRGITIPESVTVIENAVFQQCSNLQSVSIPNGVTNIGNFTFESCSALSSIDISESIIGIGYYAFNNCVNLKTINFANDARLTNIGGMAFANCTSLKTITIPDSVTIIGYQNFYGCTGLETLILPDTLEIISDYAFYNCKKLTNMEIPIGVQIIGSYAFYACSSLPTLVLPSNISKISGNSFRGCSLLTEITIPNDVLRIEDYAFYQCTNLQKVNFNNNLNYIGGNAFSGCSKLNDVKIPNSVQTLGGTAFSGCKSLTKIVIPKSITSWSTYVFNGCSALKSVELESGNQLTSIPAYSFQSCTSLNEVIIPESNKFKTIDSAAFYGCTSLESIDIPDTVTTINSSAFYNCTSLKTLRMPNNLQTIGSRAFENCSALTEISNLTTNLKTVNSYAFSDCKALDNIVIPEGITTFGTHVFNGCVGLENVTIENASICSKIIDLQSPGYLITYAKTIKVLNSITIASDNYLMLSNNYTKSSSGSYDIFTLK